jgi:ribonuclease VapC
VLDAARLKSEHAISYADCFAAATAIKEGASIVTGDPEFKKVENKAPIIWF